MRQDAADCGRELALRSEPRVVGRDFDASDIIDILLNLLPFSISSDAVAILRSSTKSSLLNGFAPDLFEPREASGITAVDYDALNPTGAVARRYLVRWIRLADEGPIFKLPIVLGR